MPEPALRVVHTAELGPGDVDAVRALMSTAFAGDFSDDDLDHALGGMHALLREDGALIGHAAVVQRTLIAGDATLRAGYVEAMAVHPERQGRGHGAALMAAVERIVDRAYDLGALSSTEGALGFYAARGWRAWRGPTWALTPDGRVRTADDDGGVLVRPVGRELVLDAALTCDWRRGDLW